MRIIDAETREMTEFFAKVIFLNASALGSTFILLNSLSDRFPNGGPTAVYPTKKAAKPGQ